MRLTLLLLTSLIATALYSQVTIGMDESPAGGAILQLKQTGGETMNSTKGMGAPRVNLTRDNALYPMFAIDPDADTPSPSTLYDNAQKKSEQDALHIGLMVYNTNACLTHIGDSKGLQVWDGERWAKMGAWTGTTVTGRSGRVYKTVVFGNAEWMIEDLEETEYDTEAEASGVLATGRNGMSGNTKLKVYYFPTNPDPASGYGPFNGDLAHDRKFYDDHRQYGIGLIYSWAAATADNYTDVVLSTEAPATDAYSTVQGICPNGWRMPSERDWLDLEKAIADNRLVYSSNPEATPWSVAYETGDGDDVSNDQAHRGKFGNSIKSPCTVAGYSGGGSYIGYSKPDGFNLLLVGYIGTNHQMDYFGTFTGLFTSSLFQKNSSGSPDTQNVWGRAIGNNPAGVRRDRQAIEQLQPVRCVKARK